MIKELDFAESCALRVLHSYKLKGKFENEQVAEEVTKEYKSGMNDPSRDAARVERMAAIKKNVGKKKIINDYIKLMEQSKMQKHYNF